MSPVIDEEKVEQEPAASADARAADASLASRAAGMVASDVITSPEALPFDRVSRQRLLVAQTAADTLERLAESGAWERLEPALARHLVSQARRLSGYVEGLTRTRPVRSSEPALLLLRRLERRLQIAAELAEGDDERRATSGGLFFGDFTESEAEPGGTPAAKPDGAPQKEKKREKKPGLRHHWATKGERLAALRQSRRVMTYIGVGFIAIAASLAWRAFQTLEERRLVPTPPKHAFTPSAYLSDVQIFLPAVQTAQLGNDLNVAVSKEWLLRSESQRVQDANGAAVFLLNRNVRRVRMQWEDGLPIVSFEDGVATWFNGSTNSRHK